MLGRGDGLFPFSGMCCGPARGRAVVGGVLFTSVMPRWRRSGCRSSIRRARVTHGVWGCMVWFGTRPAGSINRATSPRCGNLRRPRRYNRRLQRVFYISALFSIRHCEDSRRFYDRKRSEGKRHIQAVLALARRRVNVLWALLRGGRTYEAVPPATHAA